MTDKKKLAELVREAKERYIYSDEIAQYLIDHGVVAPVMCKDCKYAKRVIYRGGVIDWSYKCTYLKPNTNMFDIDYCRYGRREEADNGERRQE